MVYHRYQLLRRIGGGGMGEVWIARDQQLRRDVAVKLIKADWLSEPLARLRWAREVRALVALEHPNIVRIFDEIEVEGTPGLVMELIDGRHLGEILSQDGPLPRSRALAIAADLLHALDTMHARGFVHRDIKAPNVMIDATGRVVLMDMGLVLAEADNRITAPGGIVGTPNWMAPEVMAGLKGDARIDLYQVGLLLDRKSTRLNSSH